MITREKAEALFGKIHLTPSEYWIATFDNYDGAPDSSTRNLVGWGATKEQAIEALLESADYEVDSWDAPDMETALEKSEYEEER